MFEPRRKKTGHAVLTALLMASLLQALPASAAAPQQRSQGPGYYRTMLGHFEITALSDGTHAFPIDTVMTGVSPSDIAGDLAREALTVPVQGSINAFLVNTGTKLILIDTGAGLLYGDCCGKLMANLRAAGYAPEQVDEILLTHLHKDHVGGVLAGGKMAFPNAVLRVSQVDAAYWLTVSNKAQAPGFLASFFDSAATALAPYQAAGHFKPFALEGSGEGDGTRLEAGIRAVAAPGHTPGHTMYEIDSDGKMLFVWGDIVHIAAIQLRDPAASVTYDSDAAAAQASRRALFALAVQRDALIGAAHIAFPGLGHLRAQGGADGGAGGGGYRWIPLNYDADPGRP